MAFHDYKTLNKKEKVWTFESLKVEYEKLNKEVKHLKKENSEYYTENKKLEAEIKYFKDEKKNFKYLQENLDEEIKMLKKQLAHFQKN